MEKVLQRIKENSAECISDISVSPACLAFMTLLNYSLLHGCVKCFVARSFHLPAMVSFKWHSVEWCNLYQLAPVWRTTLHIWMQPNGVLWFLMWDKIRVTFISNILIKDYCYYTLVIKASTKSERQTQW